MNHELKDLAVDDSVHRRREPALGSLKVRVSESLTTVGQTHCPLLTQQIARSI